jgi:hypothetical protein
MEGDHNALGGSLPVGAIFCSHREQATIVLIGISIPLLLCYLCLLLFKSRVRSLKRICAIGEIRGSGLSALAVAADCR